MSLPAPTAALIPAPPRQALLVALIAALVCIPWLWHSGFAMSESHRALPGFTMARTGDWVLPVLFEQPYLRKPPGVPWMIGAAATLLGETEFAARLPSALCGIAACLLTWWFTARWFGAQAGLFAGIAHALTPLFWYPWRSSEIESPHNLFAQFGAFLLVHTLLFRPPWTLVGKAVHAAGLCIAFSGALFTKGPAAVPVFLGVCIAAGLLHARLRGPLEKLSALRVAPILLWRIWLPAVASAALLLWWASEAADRAEALGLSPVRESPAHFMFRINEFAGLLLLPISSAAAAAPLCFGLLEFVPRRANAEHASETDRMVRRLAAAIVLAWAASIAVFMLSGVSNNRYTMPSACLLAPVAGWALATWLSRGGVPIAFTPRRVRLGPPWAWGTALLALSIANIAWSEPRRERISGREEGRRLAAALPDGTILWADAMIDARPELFDSAIRAAAESGKSLRVLWKPGLAEGAAPPPEIGVVLRSDTRDGTPEMGTAAQTWGSLPPKIGDGKVHNFGFIVARQP